MPSETRKREKNESCFITGEIERGGKKARYYLHSYYPPTPVPAQIIESSLCEKICIFCHRPICYGRRRCEEGKCHGPHKWAGDNATGKSRHRPLQASDDAMGKDLGRGGGAANRSVGGEANEFRRPRRRMTIGLALMRMMRKGCGLTGSLGMG